MKLFLFVCLFFTLNYGVMASSQQSFDIRQGSMNVEQESMNLQECNSQKDRVARSMSLSIQKKAMIPPAAQYLIAAVVVITLAFYIVRCLRSLDKKTSMRRLAGAAGACGGDGNGDQPEGDGDQAAGPAAPAVQEEAQVSPEVQQALLAGGIPLFDETTALESFTELLQRGRAIYPDGAPQSPRLVTYYNHLGLFQFMVERQIMPLSAFIYNQFAMNTLAMERIVQEEQTLQTLIDNIPNITDDNMRAAALRRVAEYRARLEAQAIPAPTLSLPWMQTEFQWLGNLLKLALAPIRLEPLSIEDIFARLSTGEIISPTEIRRLGLRLHSIITEAQAARAAASVTREAVAAEAEARRQAAQQAQQQQQEEDDDEEFKVPPGGQPGPDGEVE